MRAESCHDVPFWPWSSIGVSTGGRTHSRGKPNSRGTCKQWPASECCVRANWAAFSQCDDTLYPACQKPACPHVSWNCCLMDLSVVGQMFSKHHVLLHTCHRTHSETFRCEFVQSKQWSPEIHWILLGEEANFVSSFVHLRWQWWRFTRPANLVISWRCWSFGQPYLNYLNDLLLGNGLWSCLVLNHPTSFGDMEPLSHTHSIEESAPT